MADSPASTACALCGGPLDEHDLDRGTCHECRSPKGKIADLDIAIRASGDDPKRISDWPVIRHALRKRFGENRSDAELWERCTDWLRAEGRLTPNDYLPLPLNHLQWLLEHGFTRPGQQAANEKLEALHTFQRELENWNSPNSPSETGYIVEAVPAGHPLHAAVVGLQPFYGGSLPKPALGHWRRFLRIARNHEEDAEDEAESLLEWVSTEIKSYGTRQQSDCTGLVGRLLDGPDDAELSSRELALLEAHLKQPVSLAQMQREAKAEGKSEPAQRRNKLKLIRDFNRKLRATTSDKIDAESRGLERLAEEAAAYASHLDRYLRARAENRIASEDFGRKADLGDAIWELPDGTSRPWPVTSAAARRVAEAKGKLKATSASLQQCSELIESGVSRHHLKANTEPLTALRLARDPTEQQILAAITSAESVRTEAVGKASVDKERVVKDPESKLVVDTDRVASDGEPAPDSPTGFLGGTDLADALRIHATRRDAFFRQLQRQRIRLGDDCWHEVREPRPNSPRFLYRVDSPKLRELATPYKNPKPA